MPLTRDQVLQLAPDDSAAKAGQQLASPGKWVTRYAHPAAIWGFCQGSGSQPYRTMIDLGDLSASCSCPSRKFPCKHGIGLMLLFASSPDGFSAAASLDPKVEEWLEKRQNRAAAKEAKATAPPKPVDEKAQQKRVEAREKKVEGGIAELRAWLKDMVRTGIQGVPANAHKFSQNITARMVDAQAPGLAAQLRKLQSIQYFADGWQEQTLRVFSKTYLIMDAYERLETLSADWQAEVQTLVGWAQAREEVLAGAHVHDRWAVLGRREGEESNLTVERIWLHGQESNRFALLLNFYVGKQRPSPVLMPGTTMVGQLAFYTSPLPLRALVAEHATIAGTCEVPHGHATIADILAQATHSLTLNPFAEELPCCLRGVVLYWEEGKWSIVDAEQGAMALANGDEALWKLLATSQGRKMDVVGLLQLDKLDLLGAWIEGIYHPIA